MVISPSGVSGGLHPHIVRPTVAARMILPNGFPLPPISENIAQAVGAGYMDAFNDGCKGFLATRLTSLVASILPLKPGQSKLNCINNEQKKSADTSPAKSIPRCEIHPWRSRCFPAWRGKWRASPDTGFPFQSLSVSYVYPPMQHQGKSPQSG